MADERWGLVGVRTGLADGHWGLVGKGRGSVTDRHWVSERRWVSTTDRCWVSTADRRWMSVADKRWGGWVSVMTCQWSERRNELQFCWQWA